MNTSRVVLYFTGVVLVLIALWLLFFEAGLNKWIPIGIAVAALILILGVAIMTFAEQDRNDSGGREDVNINKRVEERPVDVGDHETRGRSHD